MHQAPKIWAHVVITVPSESYVPVVGLLCLFRKTPKEDSFPHLKPVIKGGHDISVIATSLAWLFVVLLLHFLHRHLRHRGGRGLIENHQLVKNEAATI